MMLKKITSKIEELLKDEESIVIAIEGMSASGKTTLANKLSKLYDSNVIHADDFFLPLDLRTKDRLNEAGGNINYEYMKESVIDKLDSNIIYKPFSCKTMTFLEEVILEKRQVTIVEGAYSLHPYFRDYYNLSIFLEVDSNIQEERIVNRNGIESYHIFKDKWIPLENKYFHQFDIKDKADIVINTSILKF